MLVIGFPPSVVVESSSSRSNQEQKGVTYGVELLQSCDGMEWMEVVVEVGD